MVLISEDNYMLARLSTELQMMGYKWFDVGFSCFDITYKKERWSLAVSGRYTWFKLLDRNMTTIMELSEENYLLVLTHLSPKE